MITFEELLNGISAEKFDIDKILPQYEKLYKQMIKKEQKVGVINVF